MCGEVEGELRSLLFTILLVGGLISSWVFVPTMAHGIEEFEDAAETDPKDPLNWGIYTREFRKEHHFVLIAGSMMSHWEVDGLGTLKGYNSNRRGFYERFQYSFHLPFYRKTGFILGSSMGFHHANPEESDSFGPPDDFSFPGVLGGFCYNANPRSRGGIAVEYYLERWNAIREDDGILPNANSHITVEVLDFVPFVDFFFDLHWAVRFEARFRRAYYHRPRSPEGTGVDFSVVRRDIGTGIGLVYHLL